MPIEERLGMHVKRVEQQLMAAKNAALRPLGLTVPQYAALLLLSLNPGMSAAALARSCLVTPQTMATVLSNLETKGMVVRQPHSWHGNVIEHLLTESGQEVLALADSEASAIERVIADEFSAAEREQLVAMLDRVSGRLSAISRDSVVGT